MTEPVQVQTAPEASKDKEINFEKIRKQLEQERAEKQQIQLRLSELERMQTQKRQEEQDVDDDVSDEPYVDHKKLDKRLKKFGDSIEQKIDQKAEQKAQMMIEQARQQDYMKANPDFQQVLTAEKIQKFAEKFPQIAERMLKMPDNFDRQAMLYEQIKVLQPEKKEGQDSSIQKTIDVNRRSPFFQPSGVGTAPYAPTGDFSPAGQKNAYAKLQELKSRLRI